ncbi:MAG: AsmA-like C-terminal region-containing protein [Terracidiphilus sp.]
MHTHFHAKVDGTNGDTWLDPVNATLGHSHFTAQGQVVRVIAPDPTSGLPTSKGHDIAMNVNVDAARIEDFLRLASHSPDPLLTGALKLKAKLHIPPGVEPVHKRMEIKGTFDLDEVRFSSDKIQGRITELSLRGQGKPKEVKGADASLTRSTMTGDFRMANGEIDLPALTYTVPGATIDLSGTYGVDGGALNFIGTAKLQATVSQLVGGVAGFFLKPADRFFKKDGAGTDLPIHISGTREDPQFGVDFNRMHAPHPQPPANLPTNPQTSPAGSSAANPQSLP